MFVHSLLVFTFLKVHSEKNIPRNPIFTILNPIDHYDLGYQHGRQAKHLIHGYFNVSDDLMLMQEYTKLNPIGKEVLEHLIISNTKDFPDYAEEIRGIADGAGVDRNDVWMINLMDEIINSMRLYMEPVMEYIPDVENFTLGCSDVYYKKGNDMILGHNEDWDYALKPYFYFIIIKFDSKEKQKASKVTPCAGISYPALLFGTTFAVNYHGLIFSYDNLYPKNITVKGQVGLVYRKACDAKTVDEMIEALTDPRQTMGFNMNIVKVDYANPNNNRMVDLEVYRNDSVVTNVTDGNFSHFNMYKFFDVLEDEVELDKSDDREIESFAHSPVKSRQDVTNWLGLPKIYNGETVASMVFDSKTGNISIWTNVNPSQHKPDYEWNIKTLFN